MDGTGSPTFYHTDGTGSVRAITDSSGNVIQTYSTDEFGRNVAEQGSLGQPVQYLGAEEDPASGLLGSSSSVYNPILGRFMGGARGGGSPADPLSLNKYLLFDNNQVSHSPTGYDRAPELSGALVHIPVTIGGGVLIQTVPGIDLGGWIFTRDTGPGSSILSAKGLKIPQGLTEEQFISVSAKIRQRAGHLGDDIVVQGSRARGEARPDSDIDIAIRVSPERFGEFVRERFKAPNPGSANERTMKNATRNGIVQAGEAGLKGLRREIQRELGMDVDLSVIRRGGRFDKGPFIKLP